MLSWELKLVWGEACSKNRKIRAKVDSRTYGRWRLRVMGSWYCILRLLVIAVVLGTEAVPPFASFLYELVIFLLFLYSSSLSPSPDNLIFLSRYQGLPLLFALDLAPVASLKTGRETCLDAKKEQLL